MDNDHQGRDRPATTSEKRISGAFCVIVFIAVMVWLSGCTAINVHQEPPKDWPKLLVSIQKVGFWEMQTLCGGNPLMAALGLKNYFGCAWIQFDTNTCVVYYSSDDEHGKLVIEHELMHCEGYDHIGSSSFADGWEEWKKENRK